MIDTTCLPLEFILSGVVLYRAFTCQAMRNMHILQIVKEVCQKDVEWCFEVLQLRFAIICNPCRQWSMDVISNIIFACCILHNLILEDKCDVLGLENILAELRDGSLPLRTGLSFEDLMTSIRDLQNENIHDELRRDLIEHLWQLKGTNLKP